MTWLMRRVQVAMATNPAITPMPVCPRCKLQKKPTQFAGEVCWTCEGKKAAPWNGIERRHEVRQQKAGAVTPAGTAAR